MPAPLLTREQAAAVLQVSKQTLAHWAVSGKGPPMVKLENGAVRYREVDLQKYIERSLVGAKQQD